MSLSLGCLIHCLALPVLIALLPATASWLDIPESFHFWALLTALPISLYMLIASRRRHGRHLPILMGSGGLMLMAWALLIPDPAMETAASSSGAVLLAGAHIINWRLRGRHACEQKPC